MTLVDLDAVIAALDEWADAGPGQLTAGGQMLRERFAGDGPPKVVISISEAGEDEVAFAVEFDPPYDNQDESNNPACFGMAAHFLAWLNERLEPRLVAEVEPPPDVAAAFAQVEANERASAELDRVTDKAVRAAAAKIAGPTAWAETWPAALREHRPLGPERRYPAPGVAGVKPGDEVWVKAVVTSVTPKGVGVAVRVANRVGSTYPGSSGTNQVIDGVVRRVTQVPDEDVRQARP